MSEGTVKSRQRPGRLLACQALAEPVELTDADALARMAQATEEAIADDNDGKRERWTPEQIGELVIAIGRGATYGEVAADLDKPLCSIQSKLRDVRRMLTGVKVRPHRGSTGRPAHRPRSVTPSQEERIHELRIGGASNVAIAKEVGCTEGAVRWVLKAAEEEA